MFNRLLLAGLLVTAAAQMSCGGSGVQSTTTLTASEAEALAAMLGDSLEDTSDPGGLGKISGKFLPPSFDVGSTTVSGSRPCEGGNGTMDFDGTANVTEASATSVVATITYTVEMNDCEIHSDEGDVFLGNGSVTTTVSLNFNPTAEEGTITANFNGGVDVSGDVDEGTCGINYAATVTVSATTISFDFNGNICDTTVNASGSSPI